MSLQFRQVEFQPEQALEPLFSRLDLAFAPGWTGILGANGAGKTTLLLLACGLLRPDRGQITGPGSRLYLPQAVDRPPADWAEFCTLPDQRAGNLAHRLEIGPDWSDRWDCLSPGERKRAQIAWALWREPELLALDEPTNHLDEAGTRILAQSLRSFGGVGLLVSHDRAFLESLCDRLVWIEPGAAPLLAPQVADLLRERTQQRTALLGEREALKSQLQRLGAQAGHFRDQANRAHQLRSKRGLDPKDHDQRAKLDLARVSGKDGVAGRRLNQLEGRLGQGQARLERLQVKRDFLGPVSLPGKKARQDLLLRLPPGQLALGTDRRLTYPALELEPGQKVALVGPNGAGKSSLLAFLRPRLLLAPEAVSWLPQELEAPFVHQLLQGLSAMEPKRRGRLLSLVGRLGSDPERILGSPSPSPGELRKLWLAWELLKEPSLLVLDEPTNHLDLPSVLAVEEALAQSQAALLLVSHDPAFRRRLCGVRWRIGSDRLEVDWGLD